jgi:hypothetical protein
VVATLSCSSNELDEPSKEKLVESLKGLESFKSPPKRTARLIPGPTASKQNSNFLDFTEKWGLAGIKAISLYAVDFNGDGYTDLVSIPSYYGIAHFYQYDPIKKKFKGVDSPLPKDVRASFLIFFDRNNDGLEDVIAGTLNQKTQLSLRPLRLFMATKTKNGVSYRERTKVFPKDNLPTASLGLIDFDLDGDLDLFQANWYKTVGNEQTRPLPDRLLLNDKGLYKNVGNLLGGEYRQNKNRQYVNARPTFGASICDMNQDGYADILTSSSSGFGNKLWINLYNEKTKFREFVDYAPEFKTASDNQGAWSKTGGGNSFFSLCGDYNNDGIMDLVLGEQWHPYDSENRDRSSFLTGSSHTRSLKFIRTEFFKVGDEEARRSHSHRRGVWIDYNNDGLTDLLVDDSGHPPDSRLMLLEQHQDHSFSGVGKASGIDILNPSGTIVLDVDRDGRLDVISGQTTLRNDRIENRLYAFKNVSDVKGNNSVRFFLKGQKSNIHGIGSTVLLRAGSHKQRKWVSYSYGHMPSQNERGLHFGLGKRTPDHVEVLWPGNKGKALVKKYSLKSLKLKGHQDLTLCENGRMIKGRKGVCRKKRGTLNK